MIKSLSYTPHFSCIVSVLRDEEKFLDEWLVFHKLMGVDHFFLYDDSPKRILNKFAQRHKNYLTVIPWFHKVKRKTQIDAFRDALQNYIKKFDWVLFLDVDEFVVLKKYVFIPEFLNSFTANAITLNWHTFGHNGHYNDPERLITSSLTKRMFAPYPEGKTFTRTIAIKNITSPHYCNLISGNRVDVNNHPYTSLLYDGKSDKAHINHYVSRSFDRWMKRAQRGDVNFDKTNCPKSEKWRFSKKGLLKEFVETIALNRNEYTDNYLVSFRYKIQNRINLLNRESNNFPATLPNNLRDQADQLLLALISILLENLPTKSEIGLINGLTGIAILLFHYSRYTKNKIYQTKANQLINKIGTRVNGESLLSYEEGIAGYGAALEYLVKHSFMEFDTNEVLEEFDILIAYHSANNLSNKCAIGFARYLIFRLNNPFNDLWDEREKQNLEILLSIIDRLQIEDLYCLDLLFLIDTLSAAHLYFQHVETFKLLIIQAANKVRSICLNETNEPTILPSVIEAVLLKSAKITHLKILRSIANEILKTAKPTQCWTERKPEQRKGDHIISLWLANAELYYIDKNRFNATVTLNCLKELLAETREIILKPLYNIPLLTKLGLSMLATIDNDGQEWLSLIPNIGPKT